jgi:hypothetical protein
VKRFGGGPSSGEVVPARELRTHEPCQCVGTLVVKCVQNFLDQEGTSSGQSVCARQIRMVTEWLYPEQLGLHVNTDGCFVFK